jgi:transcriptional regulator with XRE-family HTH domain
LHFSIAQKEVLRYNFRKIGNQGEKTIVIYENIFARLRELHMSQSEFSRITGIPTSTINDWKKKQINPQADKLVVISKALDMPLSDLLCNGNDETFVSRSDYNTEEKYLIECYRRLSRNYKRRIIKYFELFSGCGDVNSGRKNSKRQRNISVFQDVDGNNIVVINDIRFKGKRAVDWKGVREYLKEYVGDYYQIVATDDVIYIGADLPNEYCGSKYTHNLKGTAAKAKANAAQGIPEMIEIALGKNFKTNQKEKHWRNAKFGWYRYDSRFALPVYGEGGELERYNVFHASLIVRHSEDGKLYLYDVIDIKKETGNPIEH